MSHFITQQDADFFFTMEKFPEEEKEYQFPVSGQKLIIPFTSVDKREEDTKLARSNNEDIMILNDVENEVSPDVIQAIEEYGILDFSWKRREELKERLAA